MRAFIIALATVSQAAFAVDLKYTCTGLWAAPFAILDATAIIQGAFDPHGSTISIDLNLETGGHLSGTFQGRDGKYSQGMFAFDNDAAPKIHGSLNRITSVGGKNDGFRFDSPDISAIFSCIH